MDLNYFKTQIMEELTGAQDYKAKAQESKDIGKTGWADTLEGMSKQELSHAKNLLQMMKNCTEQMEKLYDDLSEQYKEVEDAIG